MHTGLPVAARVPGLVDGAVDGEHSEHFVSGSNDVVSDLLNDVEGDEGVLVGRVLCADAEAHDVHVVHEGRRHVQSAALVDRAHQTLSQSVRPL